MSYPSDIELDDELIEEAFKLTGLKTKKDIEHLALMTLIKAKKRKVSLLLLERLSLMGTMTKKS